MRAEYLAGMEYECETVQDLVDVLMMMSPKTRRSSYIRLQQQDNLFDLKSVGFAQSDQAETYELKVYLKAVSK